MAKFLLESFLMIFIGLIVITQVIIPAFVPNLRFFFFFKKEKYQSDFDERIRQTIKEKEALKSSAESSLEKAFETKKKTDSI